MNQRLTFLFFCIGFLLFPWNQTKGQYFSVGTDPAGIRWRQIHTDDFRIIFPKESENQGKELSAFLINGLENISASLEHHPRKFPLILHSWSSTSNGYTIWAPRRIELYPRPPIIGGAESYTDHLLIHEVRHMVQMDKLNVGITKWMGYLLGEQATAAVIGLHMPSWFSEGDAILTETLLSHSGRGRQALFSEDLRAIWLNEMDWGFDKALFGSYKDYVPNHYVLGYHMVATARLMGGWQIWEKALRRMGHKPFRISLLSRYLKETIGVNKSGLYEKSQSWAGNYWRNQLNEPFNPPALLPVSENDDYVTYLKPIKTNDGYVALKKSLNQVPAFVYLKDTGEETHLLYPGYVDHASYSCENGLLVWSEEDPDIRWENRSYNTLYAYNLLTGVKWQVSGKKRYYAPDLDDSGQKIVCLEYLVSGTNRLVILDVESGSILNTLDAPNGQVFQIPVWDAQGNIWLFATGRTGKSLYSYDLKSEQLVHRRDFGYKEVFHPVVADNYLYFIGPSGATNAVYSYAIESGTLALVAEDLYGINYLSYSGGEMNASVYRLDGYKPVTIDLDPMKAVLFIPDYDDPYLALLSAADKEKPIKFDQETVKEQQTKKYHKAWHTLKLHSWAPVSINPLSYGLNPGIMLLSQNDLSTLNARVGVEYAYTYDRWEEFAEISYVGLPPKVDLNLRTYQDNGDFLIHKMDSVETETQYRNYQATVKVHYPMNFSSGRWYRGILPALLFSYNYYTGQSIEDQQEFSRKYFHGGFGIKGYAYTRSAYRDLFPRWGWIISLTSTAQAFVFEEAGKTAVSGSLQTYLPGMLMNHSTRLYVAGYLKNNWILPDQSPIILPRGLYHNFHEYNASAKIDYSFPFLYPDWNLGSILYVKRLKANLFFDAATNLQEEQDVFTSAGIDLSSDFNLFRIGVDIDAGARILYSFSDRKTAFEILFDFAIN